MSANHSRYRRFDTYSAFHRIGVPFRPDTPFTLRSTMTLTLPKQTRTDAIASLRRYAEENLPEPLGELPASQLLDFFLEEIGPAIYNKAILDAQTRLQERLLDLPGELYQDELQYWPRRATKRATRNSRP